VLSYPLQVDPSAPPFAHPSNEPNLGTELGLNFSYPQNEPILRFEVAGARVEVTDGNLSIELYSPVFAPPLATNGKPTRSVLADLSVLFPRSTSATSFHLRVRPVTTASRFGNLHFHGGVKLRNGSGRNEACFLSSSAPRAGEEWEAWVDVSAHPMARASLVLVSEASLRGHVSSYGELLIDLLGRGPLLTSRLVSTGRTDVHTLAIPLGLAGQSFSLQALILDEKGWSLTNAMDVVVDD